MKIWITTLFYIICFFTIAMVIYRLGFFIPPDPGDSGYNAYCLNMAILAALISGTNIGTALFVEWLLRNNTNSRDK